MSHISRFVLLVIMIGLMGCAPGFKIVQVNDKFSDPKEPYGFLGKNNRLSTKSSQGGFHVDEKGVYLDPYVYRDRESNEITAIGFIVSHFNFDVHSGFRPIQDIVFLTDSGDRVVLQVKALDSDFSVGGWNSVTRQFNTSFSEVGTTTITKDDFIKLASSKSLEAKISGGKLSQTYDRNDVATSFIANLKTFYDSQIQ